jgi:hypothetical protein
MSAGKIIGLIAKTAAPEAKAAARVLKGPPSGRAHLVPKVVEVTRNGKTFQSTRYVKPEGVKAGGTSKVSAPAPVAAVAHAPAKGFKQNAIEVLKGGVALKVVKKSAGIGIGAVAAGNELARRRGDKDAPAAFPDAITKHDATRSALAGAGIVAAVAGLTGDILHRIPSETLAKIPKIGKPLAAVAKLATHKITHRTMIAGGVMSIANFDAAGRNVARKYDDGKLTGPLAGLKEHAFVLHSGLPDAVTKPATIKGTSIPNPLRKVTGYEPKVGGHAKPKSDH